MKLSRNFLIFSYGLFTISAQTLLFRQFITTFESNDINVGIFFGCWFLWVGLGAIIVYRAKRIAGWLLENIEFLFLVYIPVFVIEAGLIIQARELGGIPSYALLPIKTVLLLSILVNAPLSVITGMFFPVLCRWYERGQRFGVSKVYILEAAGSFAGGLMVTYFLASGVSFVMIFFVLCFIVTLSSLAAQISRAKQRTDINFRNKLQVGLAALIFVLLCFTLRADNMLTDYVRGLRWRKLLAKEALSGSFQTAQAEYLYGVYQSQWIVLRQGSICQALPAEAAAGQK